MIYQGLKKHPVREVIVHCSDTKPSWFLGKTSAQKVSEIRRWHITERKWKDIGYHYVIDRDGTVVQGRPETVIGAHVADHNSGTLGICLIGGFGCNENDPFIKHFTTEQQKALKGLIANISARTDLQKVTGHNDYAPKACPGFRVKAQEWMP